MKTRNFALCALGLAAAISVGSAGTASAQAKSEKRIPVRKDAPAAETPMAKTDTIRLPGRIDTVMVRSRPDTVVRTVEKMHYDTVMQMLPIQKLPGMYFALGGGVAVPMNNWRNSTKDGPAISGQIGYFPKDGMFGIRAEGLANFFSHRQTLCANCPDPRLYEGDVDVMLRFPIERTSKLNPVLYIMGGGGVDKFSNFQPYQTTRDGSVIVVSAGKDVHGRRQYPRGQQCISRQFRLVLQLQCRRRYRLQRDGRPHVRRKQVHDDQHQRFGDQWLERRRLALALLPDHCRVPVLLNIRREMCILRGA